MIGLACQEKFVPGATVAERLARLGTYDVDAVELRGKGIRADNGREARTALAGSGLPASAICMGYRGALLSPEPAQRALALDDLRLLLDVAEEIGAVGVIVVLAADPTGLAPLGPVLPDERERLTDLAATGLAELAGFLRGMRSRVLLEPRNRYETRFVRTLADGAALLDPIGSPNLRLLADLFHLNIEEPDLVAGLRRFGDRIGYVHLAENNRRVPGRGSLDFAAAFGALRETGYDGYASLERWDDAEEEAPSDLTAALAYVRRHLRDGVPATNGAAATTRQGA
jgi:sugar phosphate isomerase/epimerase